MFFCLAGTQPVLPSPQLLLQVWRSSVSSVKDYGVQIFTQSSLAYQ